MNFNEHLERDFRGDWGTFVTDRRDFLRLLGGGIIVFVSMGDLVRAQQGRRSGGGMAQQLPTDFNAFLRVAENGRVSCFTGKIEMGQGVITALAQMLADELNVPLAHVDMVMGDTDLCPFDMATMGSMSVQGFGPPLRAAAAEAKTVLIQLAAERLQIPVERLKTEEGVVVDKQDTGKRISYAELAKGQKIERHLTQKPTLENPAEFTVIGKPVRRTDAIEKVTGKAQYTADIHLPGMLCAKILRPPVHGAMLKSVDTSEAEKVEGVRIVKEGDLIAVLHKHPDVAEAALQKVRVEFDRPEAKVNDKTIFEHLLKVAPEGKLIASQGDLAKGAELATAVIEETYYTSYVAHAAMEPHAALAKIDDGKATIWASTQNPFMLKPQLAWAIRVPAEDIRVITPFLGGGFGGKAFNQQAVEAARLAKAAGVPVQVSWSRDEEFFYDTPRPAAVVKIKSGVDAAGKIVLWDYRVHFAGERGAAHFYDIAHHATVSDDGDFGGRTNAHALRIGAWRGVGCSTNTFGRESQIDNMAAKAGMDPVEFRLKNLKDERMLGVLKAAAEKFAWTPQKAPSGRGVGVACGIDAGTYVALMAEVDVDRDTGRVKVKRILCAQDMGLVVNPQGATIQMEGCLMMGLGYALTEEVHFQGGDVLDRDFRAYEIPKFSWLPKIETVLISAKNTWPRGGGEPAVVGVGAVIGNALFDAIGVRMRQLPMTAERVKEALAKR